MEEKRKVEIKDRISEIEDIMFMIDMVDKWTDEDRNTYNKYWEELKKLKEELKQYES